MGQSSARANFAYIEKLDFEFNFIDFGSVVSDNFMMFDPKSDIEYIIRRHDLMITEKVLQGWDIDVKTLDGKNASLVEVWDNFELSLLRRGFRSASPFVDTPSTRLFSNHIINKKIKGSVYDHQNLISYGSIDSFYDTSIADHLGLGLIAGETTSFNQFYTNGSLDVYDASSTNMYDWTMNYMGDDSMDFGIYSLIYGNSASKYFNLVKYYIQVSGIPNDIMLLESLRALANELESSYDALGLVSNGYNALAAFSNSFNLQFSLSNLFSWGERNNAGDLPAFTSRLIKIIQSVFGGINPIIRDYILSKLSMS